jgi:hypothetical protein
MCITKIQLHEINVIRGLIIELASQYTRLLGKLPDEGRLEVLRYISMANDLVSSINVFVSGINGSDKRIICSDASLLLDKARGIYSNLENNESALFFKTYTYRLIDSLRKIQASCCKEIIELSS